MKTLIRTGMASFFMLIGFVLQGNIDAQKSCDAELDEAAHILYEAVLVDLAPNLCVKATRTAQTKHLVRPKNMSLLLGSYAAVLQKIHLRHRAWCNRCLTGGCNHCLLYLRIFCGNRPACNLSLSDDGTSFVMEIAKGLLFYILVCIYGCQL